MAAPTAGPWMVDEKEWADDDGIASIVVFGPDGPGRGRVAMAYAELGRESELRPNADLIASAPDMRMGLSLIRMAVKQYHDDLISTEDLLDEIAYGIDMAESRPITKKEGTNECVE